MKKIIREMNICLGLIAIQVIAAGLFTAYFHRVVLRKADDAMLLSALFSVSPDSVGLNIFLELPQFAMYMPALLFIGLLLVKSVSSDTAFIIIRHRIGFSWYIRVVIRIFYLSVAAAVAFVCSAIAYVNIFFERSAVINDQSVLLLIGSNSLWITFIILFVQIIAMNKAYIVWLICLVMTIGVLRCLLHFPSPVHQSIFFAVATNHIFTDFTQFMVADAEWTKVIRIGFGDILSITVAAIILHIRMKKLDYIGRLP